MVHSFPGCTNENPSIFVKENNINFLFMCTNIPFETIGQKFQKFGELYQNTFFGDKQREDNLTAFCNIQKFIHAIYRLKWNWRLRRAKWYNKEDLYMNPIEPTDKNAFVLLQNNTKYVFQLRELIHVVQSSLSHCCHFFADPLVCKNPYTNLPFNKSALYAIYFAVRSSGYSMPFLFESFFQYNFHYDRFLINNEDLINEEFLNTYVENNCLENILDHVKDMFKCHHLKINIHRNFPKEVLIRVMKPYLKLYFISNYSLNLHKKAKSVRILHKKLHRFIEYNPNFGKQKIKLVNADPNPFVERKRCVYSFDDTHIPFQNSSYKEDFMISHLDFIPGIPPPRTPPLPQSPPSSSARRTETQEDYSEASDEESDEDIGDDHIRIIMNGFEEDGEEQDSEEESEEYEYD
jgi:hypothetical protein